MGNQIPKSYRSVLLALMFIATSLCILFFSYKHIHRTRSTDYSRKLHQDQESLDKKRGLIEGTPDVTYTPVSSLSPPAQSPAVEMSVKKEANNTITILTKLPSVSNGQCILKISTANNVKYTKIVDVIYQPEYSICAGFNIPVAPIGAGDWTIDLQVLTSNGKSEKSITYLPI